MRLTGGEGGTVAELGLIFLLQNFGVVDAGTPADWWPLIIIGFGVSSLIAPKDAGDASAGVVAIAVGAFFLLRNFDVINWRLHDIWPAFLVLAGGGAPGEGRTRGCDS